MADVKKVDFYGGKPVTLPRFVYRRWAKALQGADDAAREAAMTSALETILREKHPDLRKFKLVLPPPLRKLLTPAEIARFEEETAVRRRHAAQLKLVYPHVSDEFTLDQVFLESVLGLDDGPALPRTARFFTIGSCFANNVANFLAQNGVAAGTFPMAEDVNSPASNAFMFHLLRQPPDKRRAELLDWVGRFFPEMSPDDIERAAVEAGATLDKLSADLTRADCVILTLGNVVDFFRDGADPDASLVDKTYPKFLALPLSEDIGVLATAAARLKRQGAVLRLSTHTETRQAIEGCIAGIRSVTKAPLIVTLSPVPLDSVIGLTGSGLKSAIEVDCVSKARLRSAFDEIASGAGPDIALHYFPAFEIVRWIAPMLPYPNFGLEDAAARHVSAPILNAICATFLNHFLRWTPETHTAKHGI